MTLVLPEKIGKCVLKRVPVAELRDWFKRGNGGDGMRVTIHPGRLQGHVQAPPSKSTPTAPSSVRRWRMGKRCLQARARPKTSRPPPAA